MIFPECSEGGTHVHGPYNGLSRVPCACPLHDGNPVHDGLPPEAAEVPAVEREAVIAAPEPEPQTAPVPTEPEAV